MDADEEVWIRTRDVVDFVRLANYLDHVNCKYLMHKVLIVEEDARCGGNATEQDKVSFVEYKEGQNRMKG